MSALVQIMAWCRTGDKPLSEPMLVYVVLVYICVTRSQWVHTSCVYVTSVISMTLELFPRLKSILNNHSVLPVLRKCIYTGPCFQSTTSTLELTTSSKISFLTFAPKRTILIGSACLPYELVEHTTISAWEGCHHLFCIVRTRGTFCWFSPHKSQIWWNLVLLSSKLWWEITSIFCTLYYRCAGLTSTNI